MRIFIVFLLLLNSPMALSEDCQSAFKQKFKQKNDQIVDRLLKNNQIDEITAGKLKDANESLKGIDLRGLDLHEFGFSGRDLTGANVEDANVEKANFNDAILLSANFKNAQAQYATFVSANMDSVTAEGADFTGANLTDTNLDYSNFNYAILKDARMNKATVMRAVFTNIDFTTTDLTGVSAKREDIDKKINYINMANASGSIFSEKDKNHPSFRTSSKDKENFWKKIIPFVLEKLMESTKTGRQ